MRAEGSARPVINSALGELGCREAQPVDSVTNPATERRPREGASQRRDRVFGTHKLRRTPRLLGRDLRFPPLTGHVGYAAWSAWA
jgi:hypothetical protein